MTGSSFVIRTTRAQARAVFAACLLLAATPARADGPLAAAARREATALARQYDQHRPHRPMNNRTVFWVGVGMVASGVLLVTAAVTWAEHTDEAALPPGAVNNRDYAPCGTDPVLTHLPIAPCAANKGLLIVGNALIGGGAVAMYHGGHAWPSVRIGITR